MRYSTLVQFYQRLESTPKKLEKRDILAELYRQCSEEELPKVVLLSMGTVFPSGALELGIAGEMMKRVIARVSGTTDTQITKKYKETGDLGLTAEQFLKNRKQSTLGKRELSVEKVFENLRKLPEIGGAGSQEKKILLIAELLSSAEAAEAKYIVRTILSEMRIGVAAGIVRDAIAAAFGKDVKEVERVFDFVGDYGQIAVLAKNGRLKGEIQIGKPVRVMLADRAPDLKEAMEEFEQSLLEWKYDGFRVQVHKSGNEIKIFSRRMEDVTRQFPDIANFSKECIKAKECIVEGEALAIDKSGKPRPFQELSRRIQRKYDIERTVKEIPVQVNLFDLIYLNGESWMDKPLRERWQQLAKTVKETKNFRLADRLETKNYAEAKKFYKHALKMGQEGIIVKNLEARYQPGRRVGYWLKVKDILEPLDLVVVGAEWGEGKRARWLGSLILAAKKGGKFVEAGRMASGLTEEQMDQLTKQLKPLITGEEGKTVSLEPRIVVEVGYEEIQRSPKYESGYALRFPRLLRIRDAADKGPEDVNTVADMDKLFKMQKRRR
ncbi:MAG: ATP-dependent DNA ligase [Candidatus Aenigmarchaeota archaeon]|nr:ATP-dependent DNA ligase [Candidatus Aenigmarchaeota archaeon]